MASMNVIRDSADNIISVNPWSYLDEDIMWSAVYSSNPHGEKINGFIKAKYAATLNHIQGQKHTSNDEITFAQAVFRTQDLPGWYLGITGDRNAKYSSSLGSHKYESNVYNTQMVVGKESRYNNIRVGADVMGGYQSSGFEDDQGKVSIWNGRFKIYTDIQLTDSLSIFGYTYYQMDKRRNRNSENDRNSHSVAVEPGIQYIINNSNGVWIRTNYHHNSLQRNNWGNINDKTNYTTIGYWHIWGNLQTSISAGYGKFDQYNDSVNEVFYDRHYNTVQLNATYPLNDRFTLYGEIKRMHLNESGSWSTDSKGNIYNYKAMIDFNF